MFLERSKVLGVFQPRVLMKTFLLKKECNTSERPDVFLDKGI